MCLDTKYFTLISNVTQRFFKRFFYNFGLKLEKYPLIFIIIGILMTACCGLGFIYFSLETRFVYMVCPRDSIIWQQYEKTIDRFGEPSAMMSLLLSVNNDNGNILTSDNMNTMYDIYRSIYFANNKTDDFADIEYSDICLTPYPSSDICLSDIANIFGVVFQNKRELWNNESLLLQLINNNPSSDLFVGGIKNDEITETIKSATMMNIVYELESGNDEYMKYWNDYWLEHAHDYIKRYGIEIYYVNDRSLDDEIWRVIFADLELFAVAFSLMIIYFIFALGELNCIAARVWLAFSIGLVLLSALITGFGIAQFQNVDLSLPVMLIPYVLLGVGVDDMVIIVHSYDEAKKKYKSHILAHSLQESGIAISLTSICSCVALFIGAIVTGIPPSITTFCLIGGLSFFANYLMQFFIFVPLLLYDEKRREKKANFCCFCLTYNDEDIVGIKKKEKEKEKSKGDIICSKIMVNIMRLRIVRWIIIIIFIGFAVFSLLNIPNVATESNLTLMVPDDSPIIAYYDELDIGFNQKTLVELEVVIENMDFSNIAHRYSILNFIKEIEEQTRFIGENNWLIPYINWLQFAHQIDVNTLNSNDFYKYLQIFAHNDTGPNSDIIYGRNSFGNVTEIEATRFYIFAFQNNDAEIQWDEYHEWNNLMRDYGINGYIYHSDYGFSYLSSIIVELTTENMIISAIGVFIVLLLSADIRMAIFILTVVILIDIDLIGCMYFFDFSLNIITYSILIMAVGLTVDYVIHISFAILESKNRNRNNNNFKFHLILQDAMKTMGTSVLNGAFTSLLGGVPLLLSQSNGFRIFATMWIAIIVISVLHGFLFVPAVMAEVFDIYHLIYHPKLQLIKPQSLRQSFNQSQQITNQENKQEEIEEIEEIEEKYDIDDNPLLEMQQKSVD